MILSRRAVVAGVAMLALPGAIGDPDARLFATLDALPKAADPATKLAALATVDPAGLSLSARLDLATIRAGLAVDAQIARRFPNPTTMVDLPAADRTLYYGLILKRRLGDVDLATARRRIDAELAALGQRTDAALRAIGLRDGDIGARLATLMADARYLYSDDDAGRDRAVGDMNRLLRQRIAHVPEAFERLPAWSTDVAVTRASRADEVAGKAGKRIVPSATMPGGYIVDLKDIRRRPSWTLGSVVAHELVPGHMVQLSTEAVTPPHALRLDYTPAFVEGWGIYAEQLAAALGAYDQDALGLVGHLHWLLFRAARAAMDIGLHLDGWSNDRARAFLEQHQGPAAYFAPYAIELKRTAAEPASRAGDALAWLAIADLAPRDPRRRRNFHARVLAGGRKRTEHLRRYVTTGSLS